MPLLGAHLSTTGGLHRALLSAQAQKMDTVQLFTDSPRMWPVQSLPEGVDEAPTGRALTGSGQRWTARDLEAKAIRIFRRTLRQTGLRKPMAHASYLINLASPDDVLQRRSIEAFLTELRRSEALGLRYLVVHPGAHVGSGEECGLTRVAGALDEIHARCPGFRVRVLLETTAGQGTTLGHRFEHLAAILKQVAEPKRLGVCFDTCHVFAAGYALAPAAEYRATLRAFARCIGLSRLCAFHVNDSQTAFASHRDRHAALGRGHLGLEPFRLLVNDPRFRQHPLILELPPAAVTKGLEALRTLQQQDPEHPAGPSEPVTN